MRLGRFLAGFVLMLALLPALVLGVQSVTRDRATHDAASQTPTVEWPPREAPAAPARPAVPDRFGWGERRSKPRHRAEKPQRKAARIERPAELAADKPESAGEGHLEAVTPTTERRAGVLQPVADLVPRCAKSEDGCKLDDVVEAIRPVVDKTEPVTDTVEPIVDQVIETVPELPSPPDVPAAPELPATPELPADTDVPATPDTPETADVTIDPESPLGQTLVEELGLKSAQLRGSWLRIDLSALLAAARD